MRAKGSSLAQVAAWRSLLKPGWVITAALVLCFAYVAFTVLAPWQLGKNSRTQERNHQLDVAFHTAPVPYDELFNDRGAVSPDAEWRRVELHGHFLADHEVLLRARPTGGGPSFTSLTPFQLESGPIVLINRGYVPTENVVVPTIEPPPTDEVTVLTQARRNEQRPSHEPITEQGYPQVWGINTEQISELTGLPLATDFVQLTTNQPGVLSPQPLPQKERGPYLSYGVQWIAFGIMAPLALGYFVFAELRERRLEIAESGGVDSPELDAPEDISATTDAPPADADAATVPTTESSVAPPADSTPAFSPSPQRKPAVRARYAANRNRAFMRREERDKQRF